MEKEPFSGKKTLIVGLFALLAIFVIFKKSPEEMEASRPKQTAPQIVQKQADLKGRSAAEAEAEKKRTAERQAQQEQERIKEAARKAEQDAKMARSLAIAQAQILIKESLRDPDSLEWDSKFYNLSNGAMCFQYRARNGFGGMNREFLVVAKGKVYENQAARWNQFCTKGQIEKHGW